MGMFIAILFIMETGHYGWPQTGNNPNIHQLGIKEWVGKMGDYAHNSQEIML